MELKNVKIEVIQEPQEINERFTKQEFIVLYEDNPEYPQFIKLELVNKSVGKIDEFRPGDVVDVLFDIKGKKWTNPEGEIKYFTSLQAWRVNKAVGTDEAYGEEINHDEPPVF